MSYAQLISENPWLIQEGLKTVIERWRIIAIQLLYQQNNEIDQAEQTDQMLASNHANPPYDRYSLLCTAQPKVTPPANHKRRNRKQLQNPITNESPAMKLKPPKLIRSYYFSIYMPQRRKRGGNFLRPENLRTTSPTPDLGEIWLSSGRSPDFSEGIWSLILF